MNTSYGRAVFCGIVRDCGKRLKRNLRRVISMKPHFSEIRIVIVENDSKDDTKQVLRHLEKSQPGTIIETHDFNTTTFPKFEPGGFMPSYSKHRISKMCDYRNRYLDLIESKIGYANADWIIMLDWDVVHFSTTGILKSLDKAEDWDVATANGIHKQGLIGSNYYDCYAFRSLGQKGECTAESIRTAPTLVSDMKPGDPIMRVESGFSALSIYHSRQLEGMRYRVEMNEDDKVEVWCEHVTFHRDLAAAGHERVVIDPDLEVMYNTRLEALLDTLRKCYRNTIGRLLRPTS